MYHPVDIAKAHEIMAKFRPIAPKPSIPSPPELGPTTTPAALCFRSRPSRTRKRGRAGLIPLPPSKRQTPIFIPPTSLPSPPPIEQDLLRKLQDQPRVFTPKPVRPVGSSITVCCITETSKISASKSSKKKKKAEEVEEEVEKEAFPALVSGLNNKVRVANSAYKAMVGQPECPWLESMASRSCSLGLETAARVSSRRINGEVVLGLPDSWEIPVGSEGFSCRVKVEWACNGKKSCVEAPCEVIRVYCDSQDYWFTWKIHTTEAYETTTRIEHSQSS